MHMNVWEKDNLLDIGVQYLLNSGQTDGETETGQRDSYSLLCIAGDTT